MQTYWEMGDRHTWLFYYFFSLCTCTKEHIKTNISTSELPTTDPVLWWNNVKYKIPWIWEARCLLYLQAEKIPLFLVEGEHCTTFRIVSCRFARLQEYMCLDKWWCHCKLRQRERLKWQACYCVDAVAVSAVTKVFEILKTLFMLNTRYLA
jgi:hypothetical protein